MKPMVIVIESTDGKVIMDVEKFKKYVEDAYKEGYCEGSLQKFAGNGLRLYEDQIVYTTESNHA